MAKVTVVILSYNRENYLKDCLKSVLAQSFQDFEVIIFDNHSDYDIKKTVSQFNEPKIRVLINEINSGALNNLNQAFTYKYDTPYFIVFYDDDTMHPALLAQEVALLDGNKDIIFVITSLKGVKNASLMFDFFKKNKQRQVLTIPEYSGLVRLLLRHFGFCFDSIMFRTGITESIVGYDKRFFKWCDRPYFIELAKKGSVGVIKEELVNFRVHLSQGSQEEHSDKFLYFINLYNYYRECLPQPLNGSDKKLFYKWSTNNLVLAISWFVSDIKTYLKLLKQCRENDLFKPEYLNIRGLYYFLIVMWSMVKKKFFN